MAMFISVNYRLIFATDSHYKYNRNYRYLYYHENQIFQRYRKIPYLDTSTDRILFARTYFRDVFNKF